MAILPSCMGLPMYRPNPDMRVVAVCGDGATALQAIRQLAPTVAVLDILMPGLNGLDVLEGISADRSATKVVLLTATATDRQLLGACPFNRFW
jgi:DNA-binding NarL/FixJ family response regulator